MIIDEDFLPIEYQKELDIIIESRQIPFYLWHHAVKENDIFKHFVHNIVLEGKINSSLHPLFENIVKVFCHKHNIPINKIYRSAINLTFNLGTINKCDPHTDHEHEHYVFLLYLNDSDGNTVIINDDNTETVVSPKKFKAICFSGNKHYMYTPKTNIRLVNVTTFI